MSTTSKEKKYLTQHDVSLRLYQTFIKYKGHFYYVQPPTGVTDLEEINSTKITLHDIPTQKKIYLIDANDENIDITSPDLGWTFRTDYTVPYFISRTPVRRQKQGICRENLVATILVQEKPYINPLRNADLFSAAFVNLLENRKYTFEEAHNHCKSFKQKENSGCPLNRIFCLLNEPKGIFLYKRLVKIGVVINGAVLLSPEYNDSITTNQLAQLGVPLA